MVGIPPPAITAGALSGEDDVADSDRLTDKAVDLASQAAAAAAPIVDKASELASQAAAAAAPLAAQARKGASEGVNAIAEGLDNVTGGVFADQISSVSNRIEDQLER